MNQQRYALPTAPLAKEPRRKKSVKWTVAAAAVGMIAAPGLALVAGGSAAHASSRNGVCNSGEFCYYYNSNEKGSVSDFSSSKGNLGATQPNCYEFRGPGNGHHKCVKNNAASVWNRTNRTVRVYYNSNYGGRSQAIAPGHKVNLIPALKNNNASHQFGAVHKASNARNGVCNSGEFCYYYNSNEKGSVSDFKHSKANLGATQPDCYEFKGKGNGRHKCVKNNAASVWNRTGKTVRVYYNSYYGGRSQAIKAGHRANLIPALKNNNASHHIGTTATKPPKTSGTVADVIRAARSQEGKYIYTWAGGNKYGPTRGTTSPSGHPDYNHIGFDCSGLMQYAFWQGAHIDVGGYSGAQQAKYRHIPLSQRKPGDMVFWGSSASSTTHVALYIGHNRIIESSVPRNMNSIREASLYEPGTPLPFVVRPVK